MFSVFQSRLGEFRQLQYVQGGVLCTAAATDTAVVAGYSNGVVKMWDMVDQDYERTFQPSQKGLMLNENVELGTLPNYPCHIGVQENFTTAAYSHGKLFCLGPIILCALLYF